MDQSRSDFVRPYVLGQTALELFDAEQLRDYWFPTAPKEKTTYSKRSLFVTTNNSDWNGIARLVVTPSLVLPMDGEDYVVHNLAILIGPVTLSMTASDESLGQDRRSAEEARDVNVTAAFLVGSDLLQELEATFKTSTSTIDSRLTDLFPEYPGAKSVILESRASPSGTRAHDYEGARTYPCGEAIYGSAGISTVVLVDSEKGTLTQSGEQSSYAKKEKVLALAMVDISPQLVEQEWVTVQITSDGFKTKAANLNAAFTITVLAEIEKWVRTETIQFYNKMQWTSLSSTLVGNGIVTKTEDTYTLLRLVLNSFNSSWEGLWMRIDGLSITIDWTCSVEYFGDGDHIKKGTVTATLYAPKTSQTTTDAERIRAVDINDWYQSYSWDSSTGPSKQVDDSFYTDTAEAFWTQSADFSKNDFYQQWGEEVVSARSVSGKFRIDLSKSELLKRYEYKSDGQQLYKVTRLTATPSADEWFQVDPTHAGLFPCFLKYGTEVEVDPPFTPTESEKEKSVEFEFVLRYSFNVTLRSSRPEDED